MRRCHRRTPHPHPRTHTHITANKLTRSVEREGRAIVAIFWFSLAVALLTSLWDLWHWLVAVRYGRELKARGAGLFTRLRDNVYRYHYKVALLDTFWSVVIGQAMAMLMGGMAGRAAGMLLGLAWSILSRPPKPSAQTGAQTGVQARPVGAQTRAVAPALHQTAARPTGRLRRAA